MTVDLKPYAAYKYSGVDWLGEVPAHWKVAPVKRQYEVQLGKMLHSVRRGDEDIQVAYLKAKHVQWGRVLARGIDNMWAAPADVIAYGVSEGDLLVCEGGEGGRSAIVRRGSTLPSPCIIQNALHRVRPRLGGVGLNEYLQYILSAVSAVGWFDVLNDKATIAHFTAEKFGALLVPTPSSSEQTAIVRFLDHADSKIWRQVSAEEKRIALLEEQKQAVVQEAVTGRFDVRTGQPYPAYKDSGVEWLEEVPAHWEVRRLGRIGRFFKGGGGTQADEQQAGVPCVRYGDLYTQQQYFITESRTRVSPELADCVYTSIWYGDVLFAGSGETIDEIGKSAVNLISGPACCGGDIIVLRPSIDAAPRFLGYVMDCVAAARQKANIGRGFTVMHIYTSDLKYVSVSVPPLPEQTTIAQFLDQAMVNIDKAIAKACRRIDLLNEYRTRLIADVVTGKLDVREADVEPDTTFQ